VSVFVHPQFRAKTLKYDVAVLRLNQPVTGITPIAVVTSGDSSYTFGGAPLTVAGWGNTTGFRGKRPKANYPKTLREMGISVVANSRCNKRWHRVGIKNGIPGPTDICTTGNRFGPGDSGGPVFSNLAGPPVQVSLVSAGASSLVRVPRVPDLSTRLNEPSIAGFIASVNS
jgi:secreted trypsin-like serine protease